MDNQYVNIPIRCPSINKRKGGPTRRRKQALASHKEKRKKWELSACH